MPRPVHVTLDARGAPVALRRPGARAPDGVAALLDTWRLDDEWWRAPIARRYVEVLLEGGGRAVVFEDLGTHDWFIQTP